MKRKGTALLLILTVVFAAFCGGFFLGRNLTASPVLITQIQATTSASTHPTASTEAVTAFPININSASKEDLMKLPGIGEVLAQRILEYRASNGPFQSVTALMYVEGIGEQRVEELLDYATVGG